MPAVRFVFDDTGSAALTYVPTFLPDLVAGPLLSGMADRRPRRATTGAGGPRRALGALRAAVRLPGPTNAAFVATACAVAWARARADPPGAAEIA